MSREKMKAETTYHAILGQTLRELRKSKGIGQFEIAEKMGMSQPAWSRIENGSTIVNVQQLQKIGKIFGKEANEILFDADTVARSLKEKGYTVHYDSIKEIKSKPSGSQGLALIAGAVLGGLVVSILLNKDNDTEDDEKI